MIKDYKPAKEEIDDDVTKAIRLLESK